jgi:hypothetical protein
MSKARTSRAQNITTPAAVLSGIMTTSNPLRAIRAYLDVATLSRRNGCGSNLTWANSATCSKRGAYREHRRDCADLSRMVHLERDWLRFRIQLVLSGTAFRLRLLVVAPCSATKHPLDLSRFEGSVILRFQT